MEKYMLKFELTINEANLVLGSLGKMPYESVAELIGKLREQAQPQLAEAEAAEATAANDGE